MRATFLTQRARGRRPDGLSGQASRIIRWSAEKCGVVHTSKEIRDVEPPGARGPSQPRHFAITSAVQIGDRPIPLKAEPIEESW